VSVGNNNQTLTISPALKYSHYSAVETFDGVSFPMRTEVALLTRNVVIKGSDDGIEERYGGHLMVHG